MTAARTSPRAYVDVPWGQIHLRHTGDPHDPMLVMLHQSPLSSATYDSVMGLLADRGVRAVALDTPGFGMSDPPPRPWSIPEYADAVWQVMDKLGAGNVFLLGQHTGAVIASEAALQRPNRVRGLILQGLPLYDEEERGEKRASYAPGYRPSRDGSHLQVIWKRVFGLYPRLSLELGDRQVLDYLSVGPDYAPAYRAVFDHNLDLDRLRTIPAALLHGSDDLVDRFTPVVRAALPDAPLVTIPGGTDFVADEQPVVFADAVAACVSGRAVSATGKGAVS
jgi:pimeloyl-ACP methyl ester carboxylesterase